jgi:hypothetical protein
MWNGFPMPVNKGDVYIFDDDIPALALGGAYEMRASIRVREEDTDEVITLRIWHELLHAVGQPADDMIILASEWQTASEHILWYLYRLFGQPVDIPFWQRKFYAWLTKRAEECYAIKSIVREGPITPNDWVSIPCDSTTSVITTYDDDPTVTNYSAPINTGNIMTDYDSR